MGIERLAAGSFGFLPQGVPLTFREAAALPDAPADIRRVTYAHLRPEFGAKPPSTVLLNAYAFLLAEAPLSRGGRAAVYDAVAELPVLHVCNVATVTVHGRAAGLCENGTETQVAVVFARSTGAVLEVQQRVRERLPRFANLPIGTSIQTDQFSHQQ